MDVERTIQFILETQAKHEARLDTVVVALGSLTGNVQKLVDHFERFSAETTERFRETDERFRRTDERFRRTGERIDKLVSAIGALVTRERPDLPPAGR
ncbi:MAG: hypothetical protein ACREF4_01305 [Gammaproteobacteria bacterium]